MLDKLRELVFGLNEFAKANIELRFEQIKLLLPTLQIRELKDFELLEESIYKIKDLMRVNSSNLNRIIRDSAKPLTKHDIDHILDHLENLKHQFLKKAFAAIEESTTQSLETTPQPKEEHTPQPKKEEPISQPEPEKPKIEPQTQQTAPPKKEEDSLDSLLQHKEEDNNQKDKHTAPAIEIKDTKAEEIEKTDKINLHSSENLDITLHNGKLPYINIHFNSEINYSLLKNISTILFESYECQGTNIIIERLTALIVPRFFGDNLFTLPRTEADIDQTYKMLSEKISSLTDTQEENTQPEPEQKEPPKEEPKTETEQPTNQEPENNTEEEYIPITEKKPIDHPSLYEKEHSLDSLIDNMESTHNDHRPDPNPREDNSKPQKIEKEKEEIRIEKKAPEPIKKEEPQIKVEHKKKGEKEFEIYRDDKIMVYLDSSISKPPVLVIESLSDKPLSEMQETEISYFSIFSKIFATIMFEMMQAHGTNILMDHSSAKMKIVPRYQEDKLGLTWEPKTNSEDFLEQVRSRLVAEMSKEVDSHKHVAGESQGAQQPVSRPAKRAEDSDIQKKGKYLLKSLRRIP